MCRSLTKEAGRQAYEKDVVACGSFAKCIKSDEMTEVVWEQA